MFLAVDVGNTQTVLGLYDDERLLAHWRVATVMSDTADELDVRVRSLFALRKIDCAVVTDVAIASVVPPLTEQWRHVASRYTKDSPLILSSSLDIGLAIKYRNPAEIGADRLADAVAAIELYGSPVVVADFGTATNIEVIDKDGAFVGGVIAPGLVTSAEALFKAAARLAKISIEVPPTVIGSTTKGAVQSGLTFGEIDRIDGLIRRIFAELGYTATVVATGGLSARVVGLSQTIDIVNDDLTLEGLRIIYQRIRKS
ncbi:MAG: type III pantothenate kinase [Coriobacteriales bacterium]|jgi:type III pantothenate kinase|nr:type III pantothenate kinase [Coriobacteriales bacterium]